MHHVDFRCTCSQLSSWLGGVDQSSGHYCQRWSVTKLARELPEGLHAGTPLSFSMLFHARWADDVVFKITVFGWANPAGYKLNPTWTQHWPVFVISIRSGLPSRLKMILCSLASACLMSTARLHGSKISETKKYVLVWLVRTSQQ